MYVSHSSFSVPSAAVLSGTTSVTSTTITITGSVPSGTVVTGFEVRWQRDTSVGCSDEDEGTISETGAFPNSYQISGLEPGNRYTTTVTVSNAAGTAPASNSVTGTTLETGKREREYCIINYIFAIIVVCVLLSTAPTSGPASLSLGTVTTSTITVQWEEVPCLHRNGEITGYIVVTRNSGVTINTESINDGDARETTVSGLNPSTLYSMFVVASNSIGFGPTTTIDVETAGELHMPTHTYKTWAC